ncbi:bridge-like lipid transfer protein family member 1 isoform X2 [Artemia franciscana]|uniref:bridge-like lipid transfer protein family member 1 isoform X2 n=1 Tax=Artemia franciscana TaxID=6661 RepID=UPI0032DB3656
MSNSTNSSWQDNFSISEEDLKKPGFILHLGSLLLAVIWLLFLVFYSSRVYGHLLTKILNKFILSSGYLSLDSISWNFLAGKLMFKNLVYVTEDFSIRVQDGFTIFKWWRPFVPEGASEGHHTFLSRIALYLYGLEVHVYNRSYLYAELEEYFEIEPVIFAKAATDRRNKGGGSERLLNERRDLDSRYEPFYVTKMWRALFPTIKAHLFSARVVFGNRLSPTSLVLSMEEGHVVYTTKPAVTPVDPFMHAISCDAENFSILLARNETYQGILEEPPRFMGEGFVIFSSNSVQLYFRLDEAGLVEESPQLVELANGETEELRPPICGLDIKCGKDTNFRYGPWVDRQKDQLYKIFYPQSYQSLQLTRPAVPGERRRLHSFDIRLSMLNQATFDILFSKQRETKAFHIIANQGSYMEISIPWIVKEEGYTIKVDGQLFLVEASTSLSFRNLAECERLEISVSMHYPLLWNDYQCWNFTIGGSRMSTYIIYDHKEFFQDLIADWSSKSMPDILQFIPYTWNFSVKFNEFETVIPANQYNWIDCASQAQENMYVGVCGDLFDLSFSLSFVDFLPEQHLLQFWIQGEVLELYLYLPPVNTNRDLLQTLMKEAKFVEVPGRPSFSKLKNRYQRYIKLSEGWLHCWSVPIIALKFDFNYHPMSPPGPPALSLMSTPEREFVLLTPIRAPDKNQGGKLVRHQNNVEPSLLEPDSIYVELEIGPSIIRFTGTLLLALVRLKDNIFGEDEHITDMDPAADKAKVNEALEPDPEMDVRLYRPLKVSVSLIMHDIEAHLVTACRTGQTCPVIFVEQLAFEMDKSYSDTKLQVLLSPILMSCSDPIDRLAADAHLKDGFVIVDGFQFRGHALFSDEGRRIDEETIEYGWLMDFHVSSILAKLTLSQVLHLGDCVQSMLHMLIDEENNVVTPNTLNLCHHGHNNAACQSAVNGAVCPSVSQLRYVVAKFSLDFTEIYLVEFGTAIKFELDPVTANYCNLHSSNSQGGATSIMQKIKIRQYLASNIQQSGDRISNRSNSTADSGRSRTSEWTNRIRIGSETGSKIDGDAAWLEIGLVDLGPINCDFAMSLATKGMPVDGLQRAFLKLHDTKTQRLWFLWSTDEVLNTSATGPLVRRCGCNDGCAFFGCRRSQGSVNSQPPSDRVIEEYFSGESLINRGKSLISSGLESMAALNRLSSSTLIEGSHDDSKEEDGARKGSSTESSNSEDTLIIRELPSKWNRSAGPGRTCSSSVLSRERNEFDGVTNSLQKPQIDREISLSTPAVNNSRSSLVRMQNVTPTPSLDAQGSVRSSEYNSELFLSAEEYDSDSTIGNESDDDSERQLMIRKKTGPGTSAVRKSISRMGSNSSLSSTSSFSSAVSSQNDRELSLVDLRMQSSKPVSQSPLLMGTYMNHLTQVYCTKWKSEKTITRQGIRKDFYKLPKFSQVTQGFTTLQMIHREHKNVPPTPSPYLPHKQRRVSSESPWESPIISGTQSETNENDLEEALVFDKCSVNCNTIVVKVRGPVNIMLTPLVLDSLQRFLDTAAEHKSHSISVLTSARSSCINTVLQGHSFLPESVVEPSNSEISKKISRAVESSSKWKYSNMKKSFTNIVAVQTQGSLSLDKINIGVLQVGVVEELISFSALDSPCDLVCVSLLGACIENLTIVAQTKKHIVQSYQSRTCQTITQNFKTTKRSSKKIKRQEQSRPDQIVLVLNQVKEDQNLLVLNTKRVHTQLRRLRNESATLQREAVITAIPPRCSKVMFTFDSKDFEAMKRDMGDSLKRVDIKDLDRPSEFGLIMLEFGVENITGKIIKKYPQLEFLHEEVNAQRLQSISEDSESPLPQKSFRTTSFTTKPSTSTATKVKTNPVEKQETTNCVAQVGGVWFGFAAPPKTPITKKIEYTRLDWNLLSTTSPAISAWISCTDRFILSMKHYNHLQRRWNLGVMAVLMAENLDLPRQDIPKKSKYSYFSSKSLAVREDPSVRLCILLQTFLSEGKPDFPEEALHEHHLPPPDTTQQGIIVLLRQWKGSFIVPPVIENNVAPSKKGFLHVNFNRSKLERKKSDKSSEGSIAGCESNSGGSTAGKNSSQSSLPKVEEGIVQHAALSDWLDARNPLLSSSQRRKSSPVPSFGVFGSRNPTPLFGDHPSESGGLSTPTTGHRHDALAESYEERHNSSGGNANFVPEVSFKASFQRAGIASGSFLKKFQRSESTGGGSPLPPTAQIHRLNPGLDAQVVFAPMLSALKIPCEKQSHNSFSISGSVSVVSGVDEFKVDLFESEFTVTSNKGLKGKRPLGKFSISLPPEIPAFTCEKITFEAEAKGRQNDIGDDKNDSNTTVSFNIGVGFIAQQVNMPLLRLAHQIYTMYNNAQNASNQLHEDIPLRSMPLTIPNSESDASEVVMSSASESSQVLPDLERRNFSRASSTNNDSPYVRSGGTSINASLTALRIMPRTVPKSWKKIFQLLDLYKAVPNLDIVFHRVDEKLIRQRKSTRTSQKQTEKSRYSAAVFGVIRFARVRLLATLSGLKLEADLSNIQSSLNYKQGLSTTLQKPDIENSLSCHLGQAMIVLLEGIAPNQQTVVKFTVGKSQGLYSVQSKSSDDLNSALLSVGLISVDIPQHPAVLHGMMTRGTKELSTTLQEFRNNRISSRSTRTTSDDVPNFQKPSPFPEKRMGSTLRYLPETDFFQPLAIQFSVMVDRIVVSAALLPSLEAEYQMESLVSSGVTGSQAKFTLDLNKHSLSFNTKLESSRQIPPSACISLPSIHGEAEYLQESISSDKSLESKMVLRKGGYIKATADIGILEHSLTTDLLNHLVLVQKVFMQEINEVLQKVSGGDKLVPIWEEEVDLSSSKRLLYTLTIHMKGIQLTATTATNSAVRLETDHLELQISNRVENVSGASKLKAAGKHIESLKKLYMSASVDFNLSLGQIIQNILFEEAEPEYMPSAFFRTKVGFRNALENQVGENEGSGEEVLLLSLIRPLIYLQPEAVDKAILVWLNYKNAYEYWKEQRSDLGRDSNFSADLFIDRMMSQKRVEEVDPMFLEVSVDDMGICLPLQQLTSIGMKNLNNTCNEIETTSAAVLTLESSKISACIAGCFVSKGEFGNLCLRFDDDFALNFDDWKPDTTRSLPMNRCVVSRGTYEICSKTIPQQSDGGNIKWFLNVGWQMEGLDAHLDINIGRQLAALGRTLTRLTEGEEEVILSTAPSTEDEAEDIENVESSKYYLGVELRRPRQLTVDGGRNSRQPGSSVAKRSTMIIKHAVIAQEKLIKELKASGASTKRIEDESKKLKELESLALKHIKRNIAKKSKRGGEKSSEIKSKSASGAAVIPNSKGRVRSASLYVASSHQGSVPDLNQSKTKSFHIPPIRILSENDDEISFEEGSVSGMTSRLSTSRFQRSHTVTCSSLGPHRGSIHDSEDDVDEDQSDEDLEILESLSSPDVGDTYSLPSISETSSGRQSSAAHTRQPEPNIDLELNVKVIISNGKCVLYTEDYRDIDQRKLRKDRSYSSDNEPPSYHDPQSPGSMRKKFETRYPGSSSKGKNFMAAPSSHVDRTVLHIPGLDIKVLYESRMISDENDQQRAVLTPPISGSLNNSVKKGLIKKASLLTWMSLERFPEETVVSPQILDFVEKALEPIPVPIPAAKPQNLDEGSRPSVFTLDLDGSSVADSSNSGSYGSFPVDVVVYFHMQPSALRFSSLPVSRVECLLRLPSLHLVFSSKRIENDQFEGEFANMKGSPQPGSMLPIGAVGGLSVTGCLSDFSFSVFHPYGGRKGPLKQRDGNATPSTPAGDDTASSSSESERKDSLSVNVEFVKFALSRSRKVEYVDAANPEAGTKAIIRFSTIIDIGSASFKYDMRRLPEILAFPKAWYRRSIVRRVFLGDSIKTEDADETISTKESEESQNIGSRQARPSPKLPESLQSKTASESKSSGSSRRRKNVQISQWETVVVYAINFQKLIVHMNMGNVMGNILWQTTNLGCDGKLSISSSGHKNLSVGCRLEESSLDAKGGIVGGCFDINCLVISAEVHEDPNVKPEHLADLHLHTLNCRLDYMGSSTLVSRISSLTASIKDEWRLDNLDERRSAPESVRTAILLNGDLSWDQFQMLISRSTTVDVIKMYIKLEEFFLQQFRSSRKLFSNIQQPKRPSMNSLKWKNDKVPLDKSQDAPTVEAQHHRHWQPALRQVSGLLIETLTRPLPASGTILGGTFEFHGGHISLACFNGVNFKAKSWAVFSMKDPFIRFTTEANEVNDDGVKIAQSLSFTLGLSQDQKDASKAMVSRVSRSQMFPPQCKTLQDWFSYAFASSDLDDVEKFPIIRKDVSSIDPADKRLSARKNDFSHQKDVIFEFPSLQIHLKTAHLQGPRVPELEEPRPIIECSFITDFEDHILISFDGEMILFLHDLITSYLKEKEKLTTSTSTGRPQGPASSSTSEEPPQSATGLDKENDSVEPVASHEDSKKRVVIITEEDWRTFECKTWHLEPAFRLLAFTGQKIQPIGVDFILNKLGFSHARTTIPKWLQRGAMDPLDKLLAILMAKALTVISKKVDTTDTKKDSQPSL